jgi:hypothetical protein
MKMIHLGRRGLAVAAVTAGALSLAGGIAYATIPDNGKVFTACMLKNVGTIRLIDPSVGSSSLMGHCTSLETQISWNQQGLPGQDGKDGVSPSVAQVAAGDSSHCNGAGGAAITDAAGNTAYVCSGTNGKDGQSFSGSFTSPNGLYRIDVADTGITLKGPGNSTSITVDANGATIKSATAVSVDAATDGHFKFGGSFDLTGANDGRLSFLGPLTLHGSVINEN